MIFGLGLGDSLFERIGIVSRWSGKMTLEKALDKLQDRGKTPDNHERQSTKQTYQQEGHMRLGSDLPKNCPA